MNLFSQSQDPGAPQTLEVELESQRCPALTVDDVIRSSNVRSLAVWGEPGAEPEHLEMVVLTVPE